MLSCYLTLAVWWMVMRLIWLELFAVGETGWFQKRNLPWRIRAQQPLTRSKPGVTAHDVDRAARASWKSWLWWVLATASDLEVPEMDVHEFPYYGRKWQRCLKKACASQSNQESIFQSKVGVRIEGVGTSQDSLDSSLKPAKTYFTLTNL